ncbi:MAG TPA: universal stress protein [Bryobacteraceae bacterium]|nr:universal stress protein [Bryobacteraceae bacterium]
MKMNHILFPTDFSECSRALNPEVEWVANRFQSHVTLLHVFEIPVTWYGTGEAPLMNAECFQQFAADAKQRLQDYPLQVPTDRVTRVLAEGGAAWHIKNWVAEHDVDVIMMGTHGYGPVRRALLGSVAMKLLHDVSCPVWTHSPGETDQPNRTGVSKIICALELTQEAVSLLRFAKEIAQQFSASVRIIHSVPEIEPRAYRYFDTDFHKYLKNCAAKDIEQAQHDAATDFPVSISDGLIGRDTAILAASEQADLVVIGRGKTQGILGTLRTHAYDIIRQAPCPVLSYCSDQTDAFSEKRNTSELDCRTENESVIVQR